MGLRVEANIALKDGEVLRVVGPARIEVLEGRILLVGTFLENGDSAVIHRFRSYALKALSDSLLRVILGTDASVERPNEGEEVIDVWLNAVKAIASDEVVPKKIVILGPVESGKTTFAAFLANWLLHEGVGVCLIEADIGQEDVAVPAVVALARPTKHFIWQRELSFETIRFVGCISPAHCQHQLLGAFLDTLRLAKREGCDAIIVNTDGWVGSKQALDFKISLIRWSRPTHVVVLEDSLYKVIRNSLGKLIKVIYAPPPRKVRERSRDERRRLRSNAYRRYFSSAKVRSVNLDEVSVIGSSVLSGVELGIDDLKHLCSSLPEDLLKCVAKTTLYGQCLNIIVKEDCGSRPPSTREEGGSKLIVNIVRPADLKGYLVALLNDDFNDAGLGIIEGFDPSEGVLRILTPYTGRIVGLIFSRVRLSEDYEDSCRVLKCCP